MQIGCMNMRTEHQATGVHEQMTLSTGQTFCPILAALETTYPRGSHGLAVQNCPTGVASPTFRFAHRCAQSIVGLTQPSIRTPLAKVVVNRLPRWVCPPQYPPGAAASQQCTMALAGPPRSHENGFVALS